MAGVLFNIQNVHYGRPCGQLPDIRRLRAASAYLISKLSKKRSPEPETEPEPEPAPKKRKAAPRKPEKPLDPEVAAVVDEGHMAIKEMAVSTAPYSRRRFAPASMS